MGGGRPLKKIYGFFSLEQKQTICGPKKWAENLILTPGVYKLNFCNFWS